MKKTKMMLTGLLIEINLEYNGVLLEAGYNTHFIEVYLLSVGGGKATLCACSAHTQNESLRALLAKTR